MRGIVRGERRGRLLFLTWGECSFFRLHHLFARVPGPDSRSGHVQGACKRERRRQNCRCKLSLIVNRPDPDMKTSSRWLLLLAALLAATLAAYQPAWHGGLVWDDEAHVTRPELRSLDGLARIWVEPGAT